MTDSTNVLTVVLRKNTRVDDAECIKNAIQMIKGVLSVDVNVEDYPEYAVRLQAKCDLRDKIWDLLK
jgi:hypothetical protein